MAEQIEGQPADVREGLFQKQICVPADWADSQAEEFANLSLCGTTKGWTINEGSEESPKRVQCTRFASHVHILLDA
jgi:hypothetical protein